MHAILAKFGFLVMTPSNAVNFIDEVLLQKGA